MALTCRPPQRPQAVLAAAGQVGKSDGAARSRICLSVKPFPNTLHILNATNQEYDHRDWKSKQSPHIPQEDVIFANETSLWSSRDAQVTYQSRISDSQCVTRTITGRL